MYIPSPLLCESLYTNARKFSYPNDREFAKIAATFATKTAYNTAAVAVAIFQTAYYAVLSVVTLPITLFQSKKLTTIQRIYKQLLK